MSEHGEHHVVSMTVYYKVFAALMILTVITVAVAFFDLGLLNTFVAVTIAVIKAAIVALFFMHLYYGARILWVCAVAGFVWLLVMLALTMTDIAVRGWIPFPPGW